MPRFTGHRNRVENSITTVSSKHSQNPTPVPPTPSHEPNPLPASRTQYDATFREDAVPCWLNSGKPAHHIASELGIKPDQVCGQIMRYVGWVNRHLAKKRKVRGLIIAQHISDKIRYALADVPDVSTREYKLHITLQEVA